MLGLGLGEMSVVALMWLSLLTLVVIDFRRRRVTTTTLVIAMVSLLLPFVVLLGLPVYLVARAHNGEKPTVRDNAVLRKP